MVYQSEKGVPKGTPFSDAHISSGARTRIGWLPVSLIRRAASMLGMPRSMATGKQPERKGRSVKQNGPVDRSVATGSSEPRRARADRRAAKQIAKPLMVYQRETRRMVGLSVQFSYLNCCLSSNGYLTSSFLSNSSRCISTAVIRLFPYVL